VGNCGCGYSCLVVVVLCHYVCLSVGTRLTPFLEQSHPLTPTVRTPQVASARTVVAAIVRPMITVSAPANASPFLGALQQAIDCVFRIVVIICGSIVFVKIGFRIRWSGKTCVRGVNHTGGHQKQ